MSLPPLSVSAVSEQMSWCNAELTRFSPLVLHQGCDKRGKTNTEALLQDAAKPNSRLHCPDDVAIFTDGLEDAACDLNNDVFNFDTYIISYYSGLLWATVPWG